MTGRPEIGIEIPVTVFYEDIEFEEAASSNTIG